ncbi:HEAT repeat domain-containing protein [Labrys monachus]|uniref:HEAT repeat domain-containing protein n=1 Tax=Labrys monachus TaxID=217067 RepID=A0ABU0FLQ3_9HYPH|nr:HEAT repeat domain-containing protein [Labrys monachus]MDQ0395527.1 hypothetical protein [Labrys monachus]
MPLVRKHAPVRTDAEAGDRSPVPHAGAADLRVRLVEGTPEERYAAARLLAAMPEGADILGQALALEPDARVREAIFAGLARSSDAGAVDVLLRQLHSDDAGLRGGALDALRAMPGRLRPYLEALLSDGDSDVRLLACDLLREQPDDVAAALLPPLLDAETHANVCAAAVDVLAEVGDARSLPALQRCAARFPREAFLQFAIRVAVGRIGGPP